MKRATMAASLMLAATIVPAGCSKSDDASTSSSQSTATTAPASAAADAVASAMPSVSETDGSVTFSQGKKTGSIGNGSAADVAETGLPLYPGVDPGDSKVVKGADENGKSIAVTATTSDDFAKVDAWYASRLGSDYVSSRVNFGIVHITTFRKGQADDGSSVILTAAKDPRTGKADVAIMLLSKSKP